MAIDPQFPVSAQGATDVAEAELDDLDRFLAAELENPDYAASFQDAKARSSLLDHLIKCRGRFGLSQRTVADRMGTTQSAISDLERHETDPRLSTLQRYARAVACRLAVHVDEVGRYGEGVASFPFPNQMLDASPATRFEAWESFRISAVSMSD